MAHRQHHVPRGGRTLNPFCCLHTAMILICRGHKETKTLVLLKNQTLEGWHSRTRKVGQASPDICPTGDKLAEVIISPLGSIPSASALKGLSSQMGTQQTPVPPLGPSKANQTSPGLSQISHNPARLRLLCLQLLISPSVSACMPFWTPLPVFALPITFRTFSLCFKALVTTLDRSHLISSQTITTVGTV